ncbi:MAG: flagellin hook IN motif-containing protein [Pseudomonadales bacterium]
MTHIRTDLSTLFGLKFTAQSTSNLSAASSRAEDNVLEKGIVFQKISSFNSRQFAIRDASNAISFIQQTDNVLFQTTSELLQLRLLAQQKTNLTLTSTQSTSLITQVNKIKSALDTLARTTVIDGKNILDGSVDKVSFQVGSSSTGSISISGFNVDTKALGSIPGFRQSTGDRVRLSNAVVGIQGIQEGDATSDDINNFSIVVTQFKSAERLNIAKRAFGGPIKTIHSTANLTNRGHPDFSSGLAKSIAERIISIRNSGERLFSNVSATALTQIKGDDISSADFSGTVDSTKNTSVGEGILNPLDFIINGVDIGRLIVTTKDASGGLVRAINDKSDITGVFAAIDSDGQLELLAFDGRDIVISTSSSAITNTLFGANENRFSEKFSNLRISGRVTLSTDNHLKFFGADIFQAGFNNLALPGTSNNSLSTGTIFSTDFSSAGSAKAAIDIIDSALSQVLSFRAELAAAQNELLGIATNPFSRIQSQQEAKKLADQVLVQIQQQTSGALLTQANSNTQLALMLLK